MNTLLYNRQLAVEYAHKWAYKRNPRYTDFHKFGGDCTNFASQAVFAGSGVMNYTPTMGWYYINPSKRSPSWSGVEFLYDFLLKKEVVGPYAIEVTMQEVMVGDVVQLALHNENDFGHSVVVVQTGIPKNLNNILIATHSIDRDNYPLSNYNFKNIRFLHILGVKK